MQDISYSYYKETINAYKQKNIVQCKAAVNSLLELLEDLDELLFSDKHFLLGTWLESSKALGLSEVEKRLYEFNARNQVTMWGPDDNIHDYANKMWAGLMSSYYLQRWKMFCSVVLNAVEHGKQIDMKVFKSNLMEFERSWNNKKDMYPTKPQGDAVLISEALYKKYGNLFNNYNRMQNFYGKLRKTQGGRSYLFA